MEEALFIGDPVWEEAEAKRNELELLTDMQKFVGFKLVDCCNNCFWRKDDQCHVLEKYNKHTFAIVELGKCKHFKKIKEA